MTIEQPTVEGLLTVGGLSLIVTITTSIVMRAWRPTPDQSDRFGPLIALVAALIWSIGAALATGSDPFAAVLTAVVAGAGSMGIYDTAKAVTG